MSTFKIIEPSIGYVPVTQVDTEQKHPLGFIARGADLATAVSSANQGAGQFIYLQGSNCSSAGRWVAISGNQAVLAGTVNSTSPSPLAVACGVLSATSQYGWAQIQGKCDFGLGTNSSIAAGNGIYFAAGTAGVVVTNVVAGNRVQGACFGASYTSSQSLSQSYFLNFPSYGVLTASQ